MSIRIIFDSNNTAFRANSVTELYTKQGERTSAIVGTLNIIHGVINELCKEYKQPVSEVICAWDKGHSKRRKELYPEYKANRKKKEQTEEDKLFMQEFIEQANTLYENLHLFGVKNIRAQGWEADDLIYGVVQSLTQKHPNDKIVIVSTDEDYHQLIDDNVDIYSPIKKVLFTKDKYEELTGIKQELFLTYKILKGDSSDGITGIDGIGEKTAKSLVNTYGDIAGILQSEDQLIKSKRTAKIFTTEGLQLLDRNNQLINLKEYVDLSEVEDLITETVNEEPTVDVKGVRTFLMRWQVTSILIKLKSWLEDFEDVTKNYLDKL